jgi:hypothetical protein
MVDQQQRHPYLQIDETPIRYLEPGLGKAPQGYFWVTSIPASKNKEPVRLNWPPVGRTPAESLSKPKSGTLWLFTIIESAKRHGLEPYAYLRHLLQALPSTTNWNLHKLAPAAYAKSQTQLAA